MFPYHLYSAEQTEDSAVLIRELAVHVWHRVRAAVAKAVVQINSLPQTDRASMIRYPF